MSLLVIPRETPLQFLPILPLVTLKHEGYAFLCPLWPVPTIFSCAVSTLRDPRTRNRLWIRRVPNSIAYALWKHREKVKHHREIRLVIVWYPCHPPSRPESTKTYEVHLKSNSTRNSIRLSCIFNIIWSPSVSSIWQRGCLFLRIDRSSKEASSTRLW